MSAEIKKLIESARLSIATNDVTGAIHHYNMILKQDPKNEEALYQIGKIAHGAGQIQASIPFFTKAISVNFSVFEYHSSLINALIDFRKIAEAKQAVERAETVFGQREELSQLKKSLNTLENEIQNRLEADHARGVYSDSTFTKAMAPIHELYHSGQFKKALNAAQNYSNEYSENAKFHNLLGAIFLGDGDFKNAKNHFEKAIALKSNYSDAYINLGNVYKAQSKFVEAIQFYEKSISLNSQSPIAYNNLGLAQEHIGNKKIAVEYYKNALKLNSSYVDAHINLGNISASNGDLDEAIEHYSSALKIKPNQAVALNSLGVAFTKKYQLDEAISCFKKAIKINPKFTEPYWNLYGSAGNINEAIDYLKASLATNQKHAEAYIALKALSLFKENIKEARLLLRTPSEIADHPHLRSFKWVMDLPNKPKLIFNKQSFFDYLASICAQGRPFYEFGVWKGASFQYLLTKFDYGFGFDTFIGLPENWHDEIKGSYSSDGIVPNLRGGTFIKGEFEHTLPDFFSEPRPKAAILNFDSDLYSSTFCALKFSRHVIDNQSILIFDEFLMNNHWEGDELKALEKFCAVFNYQYEVQAVCFFSKQVAVKIRQI